MGDLTPSLPVRTLPIPVFCVKQIASRATTGAKQALFALTGALPPKQMQYNVISVYICTILCIMRPMLPFFHIRLATRHLRALPQTRLPKKICVNLRINFLPLS